MDQGTKDKIERWKGLAEIFLKNDTKVYIKDVDDNLYFCDLLLVGEDTITIQCFAPEQREGAKIMLYWPLIIKFEQYNNIDWRNGE